MTANPILKCAQDVVYNSMKINGIKGPRLKVFNSSIWQALWLDPTNELIALKPYPDVYKRFLTDDRGLLPTDDEILLMQTNDSFVVYNWPAFRKIGMVHIDMWHLSCPDSLPLVNVKKWTQLWYIQKYEK